MKLQMFIHFLEKYNVGIVLHEDESLSGVIKNVDWDEKKVTVSTNAGNNRVLKLNTFLRAYQMQTEVDGKKYVRLGGAHNFKVGHEVRYFAESKWLGTIGEVTEVNSENITVKWLGDHPCEQEYSIEWAKENLFPRVFTQEELNMRAYAEQMKESKALRSYLITSKLGHTLQVIHSIPPEKFDDYIQPIIPLSGTRGVDWHVSEGYSHGKVFFMNPDQAVALKQFLGRNGVEE